MAQSTQSPRRCGRGSGNPWTPSTVPDQMPVRSPVTVAPLPTDSTYSMTEFLQQHSAVNSGSSAETPASADVDGAANVGSIADSRLALPDLSTDLLHNVFIRLAPNPKDLAPLEAVCRDWRSVMKDVTWKELCLKHAGGLVEELGYDRETELPPGGWGGFYKFAVYCPGLHYPTFHHVLQSRSLSGGYSRCEGSQIGGYSWRDGLGHVEKEPEGFMKGQGAKDAVGLARRFAGDEVVMSRLCWHAPAVASCPGPLGPAPPLIACRGIVKSFESSELAKVSGAAAYFRKGQDRASSNLENKALACPYCKNLVFPLKGSDFSLPNWRYDELFAACAGDPFLRDSDDEAEQVLATGFVCLAGHVVLGLAGYPTNGGTEVLHSGEGLRLERSEAALYLTGHLFGKISFQEGQQFVYDLDPDDSIKVTDRLVKLHERWPTEKRKDGSTRYRVLRKNPIEIEGRALHYPGSIIKVLQSNLPYSLFQCVHKYILEGEPSLSDFMALLLDALKARDDALVRARRVWRVERALQNEGFVPGLLPHQESVNRFVEDPHAISLDEVVMEQKLAQAPSEEAKSQLRLQAKQKAEARQKAIQDGEVESESESDSESESGSESGSDWDGDSDSEGEGW